MSLLQKTFLPIVIAVVAALLAPSAASAQRCERNPNLPQCRSADKFRERQEALEKRRDAARGVTPACRAAHDKWENSTRERTRANLNVTNAKGDLKRAKGKKAKAKRAKALKKANAKLKKAKTTEARLLAARGPSCQGSAPPS